MISREELVEEIVEQSKLALSVAIEAAGGAVANLRRRAYAVIARSEATMQLS